MFHTLPREIWNMIYHYCCIKELKYLSIIDKQTYHELSSKTFWFIYYKNIPLIDKDINYDNPFNWIRESYYIKNVDKYICMLHITECRNCHYLQYSFAREGLACTRDQGHCQKYECELGNLYCGILFINLNNINIHNIDILHTNTGCMQTIIDCLSKNDIYHQRKEYVKDSELIISSKAWSVNLNGTQIYHEEICVDKLRTILYQICKNIT